MAPSGSDVRDESLQPVAARVRSAHEYRMVQADLCKVEPSKRCTSAKTRGISIPCRASDTNRRTIVVPHVADGKRQQQAQQSWQEKAAQPPRGRGRAHYARSALCGHLTIGVDSGDEKGPAGYRFRKEKEK